VSTAAEPSAARLLLSQWVEGSAVGTGEGERVSGVVIVEW
jgi:hypothetical protein